MKPIIRKENVKTLFETKFIHVFDLQYEEGKHYYDASRRPLDKLMAIKSDEEAKTALPDAVTCFVILKVKDDVAYFAEKEGLSAHARSATIRVES